MGENISPLLLVFAPIFCLVKRKITWRDKKEMQRDIFVTLIFPLAMT